MIPFSGFSFFEAPQLGLLKILKRRRWIQSTTTEQTSHQRSRSYSPVAAVFWLGIQHEPLLQVVQGNMGLRGTGGVGQGRHGKTLTFKSENPMLEAESIATDINSAAHNRQRGRCHVVGCDDSKGGQGGEQVLDLQRESLVDGFKCKCGSSFCGLPRKYRLRLRFQESWEEYNCHANPIIKADKVERLCEMMKWNDGFS
ncbi:unnamed protein product [Linum tenue]|uniref:Uncharacterized protein n=1 Tax=Linum tenue TaxID=586396 RepID=A0AAV0PT53_9ROSI|nr:unnamed protein product [Linum tenue]